MKNRWIAGLCAAVSLPASLAAFYTWKIDEWDRADQLQQPGIPLLQPADWLWAILGSLLLFFFLYAFLTAVSEMPGIHPHGEPVSRRKSGVVMAAAWFPFLLAFYPAPGMNDTVYIMDYPVRACAQFPWAYSLTVGGAARLSEQMAGTREPAVFLIALLQMAAAAWALSWAVRRVSVTAGTRWGWALACYFALFPMVGNYAVAAVKDTGYGIALFLWMFFLRRTAGKEELDLRETAAMAGLLMAVMLFRNNGVLTGAVLAGVVLAGIKKKRLRTAAAAVLCITAAAAPPWVISHIYHQPPLFQEIAAVPIQQVGRVIAMEGTLDTKDRLFLEHLLPEEQWKSGYNPFTVDFIKWDSRFDREWLNSRRGEFLKLWMRVGADNPRLYAEGWMTETYAVWNLDPEEHQVQSRFGWALTDANTQSMIPENNDEAAAGGLPMPRRLSAFLIRWQFDGSRFLGAGLCLWLTVLAGLIMAARGKKRESIALLPILVNAATLLAATPASAVFRYSFIYVLALPVLLIWAFEENRQQEK